MKMIVLTPEPISGATFDADRIVVFTHREGERRYREEIDSEELSQRFGLPVDRAQLPEGAAD